MRVLVVSKDKYLIRKLQLELSGIAEVTTDGVGFDALIYDCDCGIPIPDFDGRTLLLSRYGADGAEPLPTERGRIAELLSSDRRKVLTLSKADRTAIFGNERIKLTSHEYSLLSMLLESDGYVSREAIAQSVWENAADGLVNIYVHYLRRKLEANGDKVILSSRKYGYKINEKYKEGGIC